MIFQKTYRPKFPLNQFVDFIWVGKASKIDLNASHHAPLFTELIFNYGDVFHVEGQNVENILNKNEHQIISGLKTSPFQTKVSGDYSSVGLILKPYCYGMLIEKFGSNTMDRLSEILFEHLFLTENFEFEKVEKYLLELFDKEQLDSDLLKFEHYISTKLLEKGALKDFNLSISISQKSFIQKFKKHYLLTPGQYVKLKKVNTAIQLLQNKNSKKLIEIGLEAGFYDQSHFIKIFKKFCGATPKDFLREK
ncbi:helix-turn-helix domain-containing protein [Aureivirga sp. CE67]|uniref:helix-turn-helix domain-containing protein n=1 Tax=Aureivirga sp. CE67 TaxID=1788983 RepID=UPI0018CA8C7C|nr:helix-turn-helix domain-containing protein [Aureivirga sp. CE67]